MSARHEEADGSGKRVARLYEERFRQPLTERAVRLRRTLRHCGTAAAVRLRTGRVPRPPTG